VLAATVGASVGILAVVRPRRPRALACARARAQGVGFAAPSPGGRRLRRGGIEAPIVTGSFYGYRTATYSLVRLTPVVAAKPTRKFAPAPPT
jgi:hypothetical protein